MAVTIIEGAFKLEQCDDDSLFWDLYQKKNVKHKDDSVTEEWKIRSYGITLSGAVNRIILILTAHRLGTEATKMKDYLKLYREVANEVISKFAIANLNNKTLDKLFITTDGSNRQTN